MYKIKIADLRIAGPITTEYSWFKKYVYLDRTPAKAWGARFWYFWIMIYKESHR